MLLVSDDVAVLGLGLELHCCIDFSLIRVRVRLAFASTGIEGRMSESKVEVLDRSSTTTNR